MTFDQMLNSFSPTTGTFIVCLFSGLFPLINSEIYLALLVGLQKNSDKLWPIVFAATAGQFLAKSIMYFSFLHGSKKLLKKRESYQRQVNKISEKLLTHKSSAKVLVFLSALFGIPPFYLTSIACGIVHFPYRDFVIFGLSGRFFRFAFLVFGSEQIASWFSRT